MGPHRCLHIWNVVFEFAKRNWTHTHTHTHAHVQNSCLRCAHRCRAKRFPCWQSWKRAAHFWLTAAAVSVCLKTQLCVCVCVCVEVVQSDPFRHRKWPNYPFIHSWYNTVQTNGSVTGDYKWNGYTSAQIYLSNGKEWEINAPPLYPFFFLWQIRLMFFVVENFSRSFTFGADINTSEADLSWRTARWDRLLMSLSVPCRVIKYSCSRYF